MVVVFLAEDGGFAFKMAYRESHARYSPGALVLLELNRQLHQRQGFKWLDSCANPDSSVPNRLWKDRKRLSNFTIAKPHSPAMILVKLLPFMSRLKAKLAA